MTTVFFLGPEKCRVLVDLAPTRTTTVNAQSYRETPEKHRRDTAEFPNRFDRDNSTRSIVLILAPVDYRLFLHRQTGGLCTRMFVDVSKYNHF